jgi:hypothetical protein
MTDVITLNRVKLGRTFVYEPWKRLDNRNPQPDPYTVFIYPESLSTPDKSLPWQNRPLPDTGTYIKATSLRPPLVGFTHYDDSLMREFEICKMRNLPFDILLNGATADITIKVETARRDDWTPVTLLGVLIDSATTTNPRTYVPWWERNRDET